MSRFVNQQIDMEDASDDNQPRTMSSNEGNLLISKKDSEDSSSSHYTGHAVVPQIKDALRASNQALTLHRSNSFSYFDKSTEEK